MEGESSKLQELYLQAKNVKLHSGSLRTYGDAPSNFQFRFKVPSQQQIVEVEIRVGEGEGVATCYI
jgi:S-ribosylhomocysteine lyase LuxS involved in autoinducer biosynthesis